MLEILYLLNVATMYAGYLICSQNIGLHFNNDPLVLVNMIDP